MYKVLSTWKILFEMIVLQTARVIPWCFCKAAWGQTPAWPGAAWSFFCTISRVVSYIHELAVSLSQALLKCMLRLTSSGLQIGSVIFSYGPWAVVGSSDYKCFSTGRCTNLLGWATASLRPREPTTLSAQVSLPKYCALLSMFQSSAALCAQQSLYQDVQGVKSI